MTYKTAYCTDATCRSIRIIQDNGDTVFSVPSPTDPTYLNLLLFAEVPFNYVPVTQFFCDPGLLTRGKILSINEFLTQCNTITGDLLIPKPTTNYNWVAAYRLTDSDTVVAYTYDNEKFTIDPIDDAILFNEIDNYSPFLFGGDILSEYEANLYNLEALYYSFPEPGEPEEVEYVEYDINELTPFTLVDHEEGTQVDTGFEDFLQVSNTIVNGYFDGFIPVKPKEPLLLKNTKLATLWLNWYNSITIPEFTLIKDKLEKDIDS